MKKLTKKEFIQKAKVIHGLLYDYSLVVYINNRIPVEIICNTCGTNFIQIPKSHLRRRGCYICGMKRTVLSKMKTTPSFVKDAMKVHGQKYDYSKVEYINSVNKIKIICKEHDVFQQTPKDHLNGSGCPQCGYMSISKYNKNNPHGWNYSIWIMSSKKSMNFDSFKVYILECWDEYEHFFKIGKTFRNTRKRFQSKYEMPYQFKIIHIIEMTKNLVIEDEACYICKLEHELKKIHKPFQYIPKQKFDGRYECFSKIDLYSIKKLEGVKY